MIEKLPKFEAYVQIEPRAIDKKEDELLQTIIEKINEIIDLLPTNTKENE